MGQFGIDIIGNDQCRDYVHLLLVFVHRRQSSRKDEDKTGTTTAAATTNIAATIFPARTIANTNSTDAQ